MESGRRVLGTLAAFFLDPKIERLTNPDASNMGFIDMIFVEYFKIPRVTSISFNFKTHRSNKFYGKHSATVHGK